MNLNWKQWKRGLVVACVTGACTAFAVGAIVPTMSLREGLLILGGSIAKDLLLFLREHPIDQVAGDTTITKKDP